MNRGWELAGLEALGLADAAERAAGRAATGSLRDWQGAVADAHGMLSQLAWLPSPRQPSSTTLARLLATLPDVPQRNLFADQTPALAELFDVSSALAAELLELLEAPAPPFEPFLAGVRLLPVEGGPRTRGAVAGFMTMECGRLPRHRHVGSETMLVLAGEYRDEDGTVVAAGDILRKPPGSVHYADVLQPVTCALVAHGIELV